ncbi:MAG: hypothetical protein HDS64_02275 [Bacteroidales bacterium]|nr:hypothetical protein [Bacteroidales bacterium]
MKKLLTIALLLATMLTFSACEDKNEPEQTKDDGRSKYIGVYFALRSEYYDYEGKHYQREYESTIRINDDGTADWKDTDFVIRDPNGWPSYNHPELRQKFTYKYSMADGIMIIKDSDTDEPVWVANCTFPNAEMDLTYVKGKSSFTLMFQKDTSNFDAK